MSYRSALLEDWLRDYYFDVDVDLGGSGVEDFSLAELRRLVGLTPEDLDAVVFHDSRSLGGTAVRQALADRFAAGERERVMVTHGSTEAGFLLMNALLAPGDEVVVMEPVYQQLYGVAEALGCRLVRWPLCFADGYRPDLDLLRRLVGPETKMVIVNFPHNPTRTSITAEQQSALLRIVAGVGAYLLWDAAFAELTYDRPALPDPVFEYERALSTGTLSKAYGLPGLRVGWCLATPETLARLVVVRDYVSLSLSPLVELIAQRAVEHGDALVALRREQARRNLTTLTAWIEEHRDLVRWVPPQGGVSAFIRCAPPMDVEALCHRLAREHRVLLVPGSCFGQPDHARLGFGGGSAAFARGLDALSRTLRAAGP